KSIKIFYNDKKTQQKLVISITAIGEITKSPAYPQSIQLCGTSGKVDNKKALLMIDPGNYKITCKMNAPGEGYHWNYGNDCYYRISVIKNGTSLAQLDDPQNKTELLSVKASDMVKAEDYAAIEKYDFAEGDMIEIICPGSAFYMPGEPIIGSDGVSKVDYTKWCGNDEKAHHAVYKLTAKGLQEIYNEKPTISGNETPLYGKYNQATWGTIAGQEEILHPYYYDIEFKDDRNLAGDYVAGGFKITKKEGKTTFGVINVPESNTTPGVWEAKYDVTDAWGRVGDTKTRQIVQLPNIDGKISIEEMVPKMNEGKVVPGFVDFPDAVVNSDLKTVTLPSQIVINADLKLSPICIKYENETTTEFKNNANGAFEVVALPDGGKIGADQISAVTIKADKSVSIATKYRNAQNIEVSLTISSEGVVNYPLGVSVEYARFKNGEGYIDIPSTYDGSVDKYIRSGKEAELELKYVNLIPTGVDITGQFKVNDLKIGDTWCDITSVLVRGQDYSDQLPEKGNGQTIAERTFTGVIPGDSNTSCNINLKVIIPESVSLDITQALDQKLPLLTFIASFEGGNIIGNTTLTQTMAVITHPIAKGKNLVWNDMDTSLPAGYAKDNLGLARCYDDVNFHRLSESSTASGLKCIEEKYRVYNFATQKWADSSQHDFEALNNGMAVYGYEFTVKDSRREKQIAEEEDALKTTAYGKLFVAEFVTHSTDESTFILTNDITLNLSETQIAYLGEQGVKNEIKKQLEVKGIIDKGGESLELADVTVDCSTLDYSNPVPKTYMCSLSLGSGDSEADQSFLLRVQKNSWSYNTKDRTEENGASGFIVIPKSIELKRSEPGMLAATDEIFFANYQNATDVVYNLSVDKTFNLVKESDVTNQVEVNTSADGSTEQTDNKLSIGEIRNTNGQGNGKIINFSASSTQADYSKGRWTGNVTFYLDRN
ncbi:hypothetical protein, partial [Eubacterium sp.]|uniref:hypothetical protein n=1 Tax=Eubacterium sp. TaxID=142586 RepID=UPI002FCBF8E8